MAEVLFAVDQSNWRDCQQLFRGTSGQEYYGGEYSVDPGAVIDVRAERKAAGSSSIIRLTSQTRQLFRRGWSHIRDDAKDVTVMWFVRRGRLRFSDQNGAKTAYAGDFLLTRSMSPFLIECETDDERHEILQLIVPTHLVRGHIPDDLRSGFLAAADRREFSIVENLLEHILADEGEFQPETTDLLVRTVVQLLGQAIQDRNVSRRLRETVTERRLQEVLGFIELHLSNPSLSTTMVAQGCGISPRYLSYLLKQHGSTFSSLVWGQRMRQAHSWLSSPNLKDLSIAEIAYDVGFKSPAHFSRMFTRVFAMSPRDCRAKSAGQDVAADAS